MIISARTGHIARWVFVKQTAFRNKKKGGRLSPLSADIGKDCHILAYFRFPRTTKINNLHGCEKKKLYYQFPPKIKTHKARWAIVLHREIFKGNLTRSKMGVCPTNCGKQLQKCPLENQPYLTKYLFCKPTLFFYESTHIARCVVVKHRASKFPFWSGSKMGVCDTNSAEPKKIKMS
jgi:hypothetical protein